MKYFLSLTSHFHQEIPMELPLMLTEISHFSSPQLLPPLAEPHHCFLKSLEKPPNWTLSFTLALIQSILNTALSEWSFQNWSKIASLQNSPMCSHLTQSNCHCPYIGPQYVWSDPSFFSSLLYSAKPNLPPCCVSITPHLVLPQGHCTYQCTAWNPPCSTSHHTFFHGRKSLAPTPSVCPTFQSFILFSAV